MKKDKVFIVWWETPEMDTPTGVFATVYRDKADAAEDILENVAGNIDDSQAEDFDKYSATLPREVAKWKEDKEPLFSWDCDLDGTTYHIETAKLK